MAEQKPTACAILAAVLDENGNEGKAVRTRFHPTMLSRWKHAVRLPDLQSAIELARLTAGRIPVEAWELPRDVLATGTEG